MTVSPFELMDVIYVFVTFTNSLEQYVPFVCTHRSGFSATYSGLTSKTSYHSTWIIFCIFHVHLHLSDYTNILAPFSFDILVS